jgi:PPP family 3-phenylpropionic acid transporter
MDVTTTAERRDLWLVRWYYLALAAGGGSLIPFISLFYERRGLSGTEIGLLGAVVSAAALAAAPLWGWWSDTTQQPRRLLQIALAGSALCMLALSGQTLFGWMLVIVAVEALIGAAIEPLSDNLAATMARGGGFGSVRVWGSLGWALAAPVCGWLIGRAGLGVIFGGYALAAFIGAALLGAIGLALQKREAATAPRPPLREALTRLVQDRALLGLALALTFIWVTNTGLYRFEPIYLDRLGASEGVIGLVNTVGAVVELPAMFWADRLVRQYGSDRVLRASLVIKMSCIAGVLVSPSVGMIMLEHAIGGVAFSLYTVALTVFIIERAPAGQSATLMALYLVTLRGLIGLAGNPLGGVIFDLAGGYWLFAGVLAGNALAWVVLRAAVTGRRSRAKTG